MMRATGIAVFAAGFVAMASLVSAPVSAAPDEALELCAKDVMGGLGRKQVPVCEAFVESGQGTARQRAMALVNIGHAFAYRYQAGSKIPKSLAYWQRAIEADPDFAEPHVLIGDLAQHGADPALALPHYEKAAALDAGHWRAVMGRAKVMVRLERLDEAIDLARKAVAASPETGVAHQILGGILHRAGRLDDAIAEVTEAAVGYDQMVARVPGIAQEPPPWNVLAGLYVEKGEFAKAEAAINKLIVGLPEQAITPTDLFVRGGIYEKLGRPLDAATDYETAARLLGPGFPQSPEYQARAAMLRAESGDGGSAHAMFDNILKSGKLQNILRLQVLLRNNGFDDVEIDGKVSAALEKALESCLENKGCIEAFGQPI